MTSSAISKFFKSYSKIFYTLTAFIIGLFFFTFLVPNFTKPAHATANCPSSASDNCATGLVATVGACGPTGKFDVTFTWTPENTAFTPTTQWLDYDLATPMGSAYIVGTNVGAGTATYTFTDRFAPGVKYYWRINTDWSSLGAGPLWSPSLEGSFTPPGNCAAPPPPNSCQLSSFSPNPVNLGGTLSVTITGDTGQHIYAAGIANSDNTPLTPNVRQTKSWNLTTSSPVVIDLIVPSTLDTTKQYKIVAVIDDTSPPTLCADAPGISFLSLTSAGPGTCGDTTRPTTARAAYDKVWTTAICKDIADQVLFNWGQTTSIMDSLYSLFWAKSQLHPETDNATAGTGAVASTGRLVAFMYNPPLSGVNYLAGEFKKLNPVQDVYAQQGIGYGILEPVQTVWEGFRNLTYVGFVIVFVIIGFMIMFRTHLSPQAVANIQDALPRIVVALILVTFSYAIAGFMIDIMFLFLNVALNALPVSDSANIVFHKSIFGVVTGAWTDTFGAVANAMYKLIDATIDFGFVDKILSWFGGTLVALVIGIAMIFIMFKLFLQLLIAYATIVILTISAPFFFLLQALPGNNSGQTWFKQMAANIAVFPAVAIMFILAGYLGNIGALGGTRDIFGSQDVAKFPLLAGDIDASVLGKLAGIGLLLMTPGVADMIKNVIGAKSQGGGAMGAAAAGALGAGFGVLGAPFRPTQRETREATEEGARARFAAGKSGVTRPAVQREGARERLESGRTGPD